MNERYIGQGAPAADAQTRTYAARVALDGDGAAAVELGQSARVYFEAGAGGPGSDRGTVLAVPLAAVQRNDKDETGVWVVDPATRKLHLAPVRLGAYGEDSVPVLRGLSAGDWIVAAGGHLLREGEVVAPVDRRNRPVLAPATAARARWPARAPRPTIACPCVRARSSPPPARWRRRCWSPATRS